MSLSPADMPEFVAYLLMLLYVIFNNIVVQFLLILLYIYIVYRAVKNYNRFYQPNIRMKVPKILIDPILGFLLILFIWDFYLSLLPKKTDEDYRSNYLSSIVDDLIRNSVELNGNDEIFKVSATE